MLWEHSYQINTLYPCCLTKGSSLWLYRWSVLLVLGCQNNSYWLIVICCLFVRHVAFVTWCSFTSHCEVARRYDPSRSIRCAQTHCPVPVDALSKHGISARPAAFWMTTCDVTETGCAHQGLAFAQSLPNCRSHCPKHPRTASCQWENCADHLRAHGIRPRRLLLPRHRRERLQWSQNHQTVGSCTIHWRIAGSPFSSWLLWRKTKVCRRIGDRYRNGCISQLQENTRPHVARVAMDFIGHQNIQVMEYRPCRQIWIQLSMSGTKWTVVYGSALTHFALCENCVKLSVRCGQTSHRPSWVIW